MEGPWLILCRVLPVDPPGDDDMPADAEGQDGAVGDAEAGAEGHVAAVNLAVEAQDEQAEDGEVEEEDPQAEPEESVVNVNTDAATSQAAHAARGAAEPNFTISVVPPPWVSYLIAGPGSHPNPGRPDMYPYIIAAGRFCLLIHFSLAPFYGTNFSESPSDSHGHLVVVRRFRRTDDGQIAGCAVRLPNRNLPSYYLKNIESIGLACDEQTGRYMIAQLVVTPGSLVLLIQTTSVTNGVWLYDLLDAPMEMQQHRGRDWVPHGTVTINSTVLWFDLSWGIISCDLAQPHHEGQGLNFHRIPPGRVLRAGAGTDQDIHCKRCIAVSENLVRYVEIILQLPNQAATTVNMWYLDMEADPWRWNINYTESFEDIWADESYQQAWLPRNIPMLVGVSPVNSSVVYFSLDQRLFGVNVPEHRVVHCQEYEPLPGPPDKPTSRYLITWNLDADQGIKITELTDDEIPEKRTRMHHIERHRSFVALSDIELNGLQPCGLLQIIEISKSPGGGSQCSLHEETPTDTNASHRHAIADAAWEALKRSIVHFRGQPIGTVAAIDKSQGAALNYDQVFMRDFIPSALAFLMKGEHLIVKNFLVETARLQSREKMVDLFKLGQSVMPVSFKVHHRNPTQKTESLLADFGETAIGRVAPVDSGLWWIILLRAYTKCTGDNSLAESPNCQRAMHLILRLCLSEGCDTSPALLCADGCSMIDRRMGIYGYPIEIQALFFMAMRCALSLLKQDSDADFVNHITKRIQALSYHLHSYYWLDFQRLNDIYRYKTEEYSQTALNKFNVIPESIPDWIFDFMPSRGGYFIGNVSPARMDFRWFCLGNFIAILSSLATGEQAEATLDLVNERCQERTDEMSLKICNPAIENQKWQLAAGCDPENTRWSSQNGVHIVTGCNPKNRGSWPGIKLGHPHLARRAMERRLSTFSKDTRTCDDSCSMINQVVMKFRNPINDRRSRNCYIVCLDGSDEEILQSYRGAIEFIREFCYRNTKPVDLSSIYGSKIEVFTTPASGTLFLGFQYKDRFLVMSIAGRDLYIMGWRSEHGTFELKSDTQVENYMAANPCTKLNIRKQYMFLSPKGNLGNIWLGPLAMKHAFEMLHKCCGQVSYGTMQGIGILSVHFPEAARFQGVFNDICTSFCPSHGVTTLDDCKRNNSIWIHNWNKYASEAMKRVSYLFNEESQRETPPPINNPKGAETKISSEREIFKQIRILPRDAYDKYPFEHEARPSPIFECGLDHDASSVTELQKQKGKDKKRNGSKKRGGGGGGDDGGSPFCSLLDEWVDEEIEISEDQDISDFFNKFTEMRWSYWLEFSVDQRARALSVSDWVSSKMRHGLKEENTCCTQQIKPHTPCRGPVQRMARRVMSRGFTLVSRFLRFI